MCIRYIYVDRYFDGGPNSSSVVILSVMSCHCALDLGDTEMSGQEQSMSLCKHLTGKVNDSFYYEYEP